MGMGLGAMVVTILIFVVLPMFNIPVVIGRQPIEVVHIYHNATLPAPGNYTVVYP
jgi:hypothetical protein